MKTPLLLRALSFLLAFVITVASVGLFASTVSAEAYTGIELCCQQKYLDYLYDGISLWTAGCGIFSLTNAVGCLTGEKIDVVGVADWAYEKGFFNGYVGTYGNTFYQNVSKQYGPIYGFVIDGNTNGKGYHGSINDAKIKNHLMNGGTVVVHVEDHYMALVGYNSSSDLYHVYDSSPADSRGTFPNYANMGDVWLSAAQLSTGPAKVDWYWLVSRAPVDSTKPVISNIQVCDVSYTGYTVSCTVTDNHGVAKVAFPTWTTKDGQDDLADNFMSTQLGTQSGDTFTFRVNISDHNNETGTYVTHIYATDFKGNTFSVSAGNIELPKDTQKPLVSDIEFTEVSAAGYTVSCTVTDNWGIDRVMFPTWTLKNGQDDLLAEWWDTQTGTKNGDRYTFRVNASEHNNETGQYVTHIYAKDLAGNETVINLPAVNVENDTQLPVITDAIISNISAEGYTVTCKVTDNQGIHSVAFPTWTLLEGQDDLAEDFMNTQQGSKTEDTYTFHVKASDHNNEGGYYVTHIYAKDLAGNVASLNLEPVEVKDILWKILPTSKSNYKVKDGLIQNVKAGTSVGDLLCNFRNTELKVLDAKGATLSTTDTVSTGCTVHLYIGDAQIHTLTVVVPGDINGDGVVDTTDYMRVKAIMLGAYTPNSTEACAADVNTSNSIDTTDYMRIKAYMLKAYDLYA